MHEYIFLHWNFWYDIQLDEPITLVTSNNFTNEGINYMLENNINYILEPHIIT